MNSFRYLPQCSVARRLLALEVAHHQPRLQPFGYPASQGRAGPVNTHRLYPNVMAGSHEAALQQRVRILASTILSAGRCGRSAPIWIWARGVRQWAVGESAVRDRAPVVVPHVGDEEPNSGIRSAGSAWRLTLLAAPEGRVSV
jgi:hypothetical protein